MVCWFYSSRLPGAGHFPVEEGYRVRLQDPRRQWARRAGESLSRTLSISHGWYSLLCFSILSIFTLLYIWVKCKVQLTRFSPLYDEMDTIFPASLKYAWAASPGFFNSSVSLSLPPVCKLWASVFDKFTSVISTTVSWTGQCKKCGKKTAISHTNYFLTPFFKWGKVDACTAL